MGEESTRRERPRIVDRAGGLRWTTRSAVRRRLPAPIKRGLKWGIAEVARPTHRYRLLPNALIIGAKRAGTTSLFRYLMKHPAFAAPSLGKGVHYFDTNFDKGFDWYRAHFPTTLYAEYMQRRHGLRIVTGEGSPYYLFHPHSPSRIAAALPDVKLIVMLRNPIDRAYSHHQYEIAWGRETLSFEAAIECEDERLAPELAKMLEEPFYNSFAHQYHSYLARSRYEEQLALWFSLFPREQFHIISSDDFYADPQKVYDGVLEFLELPAFALGDPEALNAVSYSKIDPETRRRLNDYFSEPNRRLYELLGSDYAWR